MADFGPDYFRKRMELTRELSRLQREPPSRANAPLILGMQISLNKLVMKHASGPEKEAILEKNKALLRLFKEAGGNKPAAARVKKRKIARK